MVSARELVGRTIVAFDPGVEDNSDHTGRKTGILHQPTITLDDGSILWFTTEESGYGGDYGTKILRQKPKAKGNR